MASKSDKEKKSAGKTAESKLGKETAKKASPKPQKQPEEDDDDLDVDDDMEVSPSAKKGAKAATSSKKEEDDEDDDEEGEEVPDDWEKPEEEEEWDPDFEEFDIPKSKGKKTSTGTGGKKGVEEDDDLKFEDDEFKDLFGDKNYDDDEEDDDY